MQANSACGELACMLANSVYCLYPGRWEEGNGEQTQRFLNDSVRKEFRIRQHLTVQVPSLTWIWQILNISDHFMCMLEIQRISFVKCLLFHQLIFSSFTSHECFQFGYTSSTRNFFVGLCVFPEMVNIENVLWRGNKEIVVSVGPIEE